MWADPDRLHGGDAALSPRALTARLGSAATLMIVLSVALWAPSADRASAQRASEQRSGLRADVVRVPFPKDDGTLTPYTFTNGYSLVGLIYDTLMVRDAGGSPEQWLVRSLRKSDAGRRITLRLRDDLRWHDGRRLTAADVAFTFDYFARRFHPRFTPQLQAIEGTRALNPRTVEFTLSQPSPGFTDQPLSDVPILPRHLWEDLPAGALAPEGLPIGSGPYRLVAHRTGRSYRFRANRGYFRGPPKVATIEVPIIRDSEKTIRVLLNRQVDVLPVTLPDGARGRVGESVFEIDTGPQYNGTTLTFNLRRAPFDRPAARRAVSRALDLRRIARTAGGADARAADNGYLHPASGWASPSPVQRFEARRARSQLADLDLPQIRIMAPDNDPVGLEAGRQVVLSLERAGASAVLVELPADQLAAAVGQDGASPDFEAAIQTSSPLPSYEPDFLRAVFGSGDAPLNYSGYRSARFDGLAARVASETDPKKRRARVQSELELLARDAPVIPLFFREGAFAYRPQIYDGWVFVLGDGIFNKRSFLRRAIEPGERGAGATLPAGSEGAGGGIGVLGIAALVLLGLVPVLLLVLGLTGRLARR